MVPLQPLVAELKTGLKEELLIQSSVTPRFSVQICLICVLWKTPLFDEEILSSLGGPLRQLFPHCLFFSSFEFLGLLLISHSCHVFSRQICVVVQERLFPRKSMKELSFNLFMVLFSNLLLDLLK